MRAPVTPFLQLSSLCLSLALLPGCAGPQVKPAESSVSPEPASVAAPPVAHAALRGVKPGSLEDPWEGTPQPKEPRKLVIKPPIKAPAIKPARALDLPPRERAELPNGMGIVLVPDAQLPLVTVTLLLATGNIDDPASKVGLADFTSEMLRQGVKGLGADEISEKVDRAGASLRTSCGYEVTTISCRARKRALYTCLDIVAQLALRPTFPSGEMKEVREKLAGAVRRTRDVPGTLAALHFANLLYGDGHPAGRPMTERTVKAIKREDILRFHRRHYIPGAAVLAISGDIDSRAAMRRVRSNFLSWPKRRRAAQRVRPVRDPKRGMKLLLVDKPNLSQSFFALGHAGVWLTHPERDAVRVVNFVLGGGGFNSRLMKVVRSKGGKTYGISSDFEAHSVDGSFQVASFTRNDEIVRTLELVTKELQTIRTSPPTEDEILQAKGKIAGGYMLRFQTSAQIAHALAEAYLRGLPESYVTELPIRVQKVDVAGSAEAARMYLSPHRLVGAIVGKAEVVAPLLTKAGWSFTQVSYLDPISKRRRRRRGPRRKSTPAPKAAPAPSSPGAGAAAPKKRPTPPATQK